VSEPELFVICKNCSAEVSPYVTECPYCGQRVRKRAPKIDRRAPEEPERRRRQLRKMPSLGRLRRDEIPGIAPDTRPYATGAIVIASLVSSLVIASGKVTLFDLGGIYFKPPSDEWWRYFATPFLHNNGVYQFVALIAVAIFGTHLERRFGFLTPILVFLAAGAGGALVSVEIDRNQAAIGANGAALGLLCAWLVEDRLAFRRGEDRGNDLIGVYVIAVVLLLLSVAWDYASIYAALGGAAIGALLAFPLRFVRR
jgi:membrane associated rhomboid family serine protease/DNA-directed RNA polymerase subunit RPC12/RpoP